jgi:hypothetical protein
MLLPLVAANSTSNASPFSDWLSPTGLGTIVLAIGVFFAAYQIHLDRKDRQMDREQELNERPHFEFVRLRIDVEQLRIVKSGNERMVKLGVLKFFVENKGLLAAKNAQPFVIVGKDRGDETFSAIWTIAGGQNAPVTIETPAYVGDSFEELAEWIRVAFMADGKWSHLNKRDMAPNAIVAAVALFTIEGCDLSFDSNLNRKGQPYPQAGKAVLSIVMDNAPASDVLTPKKFRLKAWNELEFL